MTETAHNDPSPIPDPAAGLRGAKAAVLQAFQQFGAMTDDELVERTGLKKGTASPRRNDLVKLGLIWAVGQKQTETGASAAVWDLVPPDKREEAGARARERGPRTQALSDKSLEWRLHAVRQLLDMDDINVAIRDQHGRAWSRVRGRAHERRGARERERRELNAQIREAELRGSPIAEFYKLRRNLINATEGVRAVRRLVGEELDRRNAVEALRIPVAQWPHVADLLNDLAAIVEDTSSEIRDVLGVLGDDVIEGTVVDFEEIHQLSEGSGETDAS
jgi:hypothetical protein